MANYIYKVGIIVVTNEEDKSSSLIANQIKDCSQQKKGSNYEIIDISSYDLSLENITINPSILAEWENKVNSLNGFVFIVPEYNHFINSSIKNAMLLTRKYWTEKSGRYSILWIK